MNHTLPIRQVLGSSSGCVSPRISCHRDGRKRGGHDGIISNGTKEQCYNMNGK